VGELGAALDGIATALGKPAGTVLQWSRNLRRPAQRAEASDGLAAAPLRLTNVVVLKAAIRAADSSAPHAALLSADALLRLLERALWFVADRNGEADLTVARVAGFTRAQLDAALDLGRSMRTRIRWDVLRAVRIGDPRRQRPLQAAGIAAGALHSAFAHGDTGDLARLAPVIEVRGTGATEAWGVVIVGPRAALAAQHRWWPEMAEHIARRQQPPRPRPRPTPSPDA